MSFQKIKRPLKGDLLRVYRNKGYYHFGIAVSEDRVIHFTAPDGDLSENKRELKIIETPLDKFVRGDELEIETPYSSPYTRDEVVERAKKFVNCSRFRNKTYNFVSNNCEHFARYCYDGKSESKQVIDGALLTVALGAAVVGAVAGAVVHNAKKKIAKK